MKRRALEALRASLPAGFLLLAFLLGGASGQGAGAIANAILQMVSLVVILFCLWKARRAGLPAEARPLAWLVALFILAILLSFIPLPAGLWQQLPLRGTVASGLAMIGLADHALPLSLAPQRTLESLLWLLPPVAAFLLVLGTGDRGRKSIMAGILIAAMLFVLLGVAQRLSGPLGLRPYEVTNPGLAVGMFANANHFATFLLCALPFSGYLAARAARRQSRSKRVSGYSIAIATGLFLAIGVAIIGSRAGYGLLLVSGGATLLIYRRAAVGRLSPLWLGTVSALFLAILALAFTGPLHEEALTGKFTDQRTSRKVMAQTTLVAIEASFPVGTGLGSFPQVYRTFEQRDAVGRELVNHAHNDYLEFVLELGAVAALLILALLAWWVSRSVKIWRSDAPGGDLGRVGSVIILVVLFHSLVDYPIRTSAIAALFAAACALMMQPWGARVRAPRGTSASSNVKRPDLRHLEAD